MNSRISCIAPMVTVERHGCCKPAETIREDTLSELSPGMTSYVENMAHCYVPYSGLLGI